MPRSQDSPLLILFDGECATCHFLVKFILRRRGRDRFRFMPLRLLAASPFRENVQSGLQRGLGESVVVIQDAKVLERTHALLAILQALGFPWALLGGMLRWIPIHALNVLYDGYARNRYRIAGRAAEETLCTRPVEGTEALFVREIPKGTFPSSCADQLAPFSEV